MSTGKKITELRVCDLKAELEKRGFETAGIKIALLERLQKVQIICRGFFQLTFSMINWRIE